MAKKRSGKKLPAQIKPLVWGYLCILEKQGVSIERAYLFGSWAKGTPHKWSDIDLAIVSPSFKDWEKKTKKLARAKYLDLEAIEPHGFHPNDFDPRVNPVAHEILKHGIRII